MLVHGTTPQCLHSPPSSIRGVAPLARQNGSLPRRRQHLAKTLAAVRIGKARRDRKESGRFSMLRDSTRRNPIFQRSTSLGSSHAHAMRTVPVRYLPGARCRPRRQATLRDQAAILEVRRARIGTSETQFSRFRRTVLYATCRQEKCRRNAESGRNGKRAGGIRRH
jgi:hypothetical protein